MSTTKVYIVFYSLFGHVETMAREVHRGASSVEGVQASMWLVPETLPQSVLEKMKAPPKSSDVAEIKPEQLVDADGFLFGFPSRFGMMPAQFLAFFDATSELWAPQSLAGKPAGVFWSTGFYGGGQENAAYRASMWRGCLSGSQESGTQSPLSCSVQGHCAIHDWISFMRGNSKEISERKGFKLQIILQTLCDSFSIELIFDRMLNLRFSRGNIKGQELLWCPVAPLLFFV